MPAKSSSRHPRSEKEIVPERESIVPLTMKCTQSRSVDPPGQIGDVVPVNSKLEGIGNTENGSPWKYPKTLKKMLKFLPEESLQVNRSSPSV